MGANSPTPIQQISSFLDNFSWGQNFKAAFQGDSIGESKIGSPLHIVSRGRSSGVPVGLQNVGNTCYSNSLLQILFRIEPLANLILNMPHLKALQDLAKNPLNPFYKKRSSIELVINLQHLFLSLTASNQKYANPSKVLHSCTDDQGNLLSVGEQQDFTEYAVNFFERIEDVLKMVEEYDKQLNSQKDITHSGFLNYSEVPSEEFKLKGKTTPEGAMLNEFGFSDSFIEQTGVDYSSPKKKISISPESCTMIQKLFFGISKPVLKTTQESVGQDETIGPVVLRPSEGKDFYAAWEEHFYHEVENYPGMPQGQNAVKWDLVKQFPEVLCFQVQRVNFNKETMKPEKDNSKFLFDETIYSDRFLLENKEKVEQIRHDKKKIEGQIVLINQRIAALQGEGEGKGNQQKLISAITEISTFLESVANQDEASVSSDLSKSIGKEWAQVTKHRLEELTAKINQEVELLTAKKILLELELSKLYSSLDKSKYKLFAMIIHQGTAQSGHYYACIRQKANTWFKFNDFDVKPIDSKTVMDLGFGGATTSNASCLFYMSEDMFYRYSGHTFQLPNEEKLGGYYRFISQPKLADTISANLAFEEELKKVLCQKIITQYKSLLSTHRASNAKEYQALVKRVHSLDTLADFCLGYCKDSQKESVYKLILLKAAIEKVMVEENQPMEAFDLENYESFKLDFELLEMAMVKLQPGERISSFNLVGKDREVLESLSQRYVTTIELLFIIKELIELELNCNFTKFFNLAEKFLALIKMNPLKEDGYLLRIGREILQIGMLKFVLLFKLICTNLAPASGRLVGALACFFNVLPNYCTTFSETSKFHLRYFQEMIKEVINNLPKPLEQYRQDLVKSVLVLEGGNKYGSLEDSVLCSSRLQVLSPVSHLVSSHAKSLLAAIPNSLTEDIRKATQGLNQPPSTIFASEPLISSLHVSLYKGEKLTPIQAAELQSILEPQVGKTMADKLNSTLSSA